MEDKVSRWVVTVVGGSFIAPILLLLVLLYIPEPEIVSGDLVFDTFTAKLLSFASLYILAIFLVATLPGKRFSRRFFSWSFSVLFHAAVLAYVGIVYEFGALTLLIGAAEVLMLTLSVAGLCFLAHSALRRKYG